MNISFGIYAFLIESFLGKLPKGFYKTGLNTEEK